MFFNMAPSWVAEGATGGTGGGGTRGGGTTGIGPPLAAVPDSGGAKRAKNC